MCNKKDNGEDFGAALLPNFGMRAPCTFTPMAPSYYGMQGRCSWIDHWAVPAAKHCKVQTLMNSMRRLQMIKDTKPRDHAPLALDLRMLVRHTTTTQREGLEVDRDAVMEGLMQGKRRVQFVEEIERRMLKDGFREDWLAKISQTTPDEAYELMVNTVKDAAEITFAPQAKHTDEYQELRKQRMGLLRQRATLRGRLAGKDPEKAAAMITALAVKSRQLKSLRRSAVTQRTARLIEEIWQAWRKREHHRVHRLRVQLSSRGKGPRNRSYNTPTEADPTMKEWQDHLAKKGTEGGMSCSPLDWEKHLEEYKRDVDKLMVAPKQTSSGQVQKDFRMVGGLMAKAGKERHAQLGLCHRSCGSRHSFQTRGYRTMRRG